MKQNNKGLSLVELIVVVAIMAVLIGFGAFSLSFLFGTQAKACAQNFSGMLSETKTGSMSRYNEVMTFSYKAKGSDPAVTTDGYYTVNQVYSIKKDSVEYVKEHPVSGTETRKIGSSQVEIRVYLSDGTDFVMGTSNSFKLSFNRSSGAFEPAQITVGATTKTAYIEKMTFKSGMRTYTISMVPETGKHSLQG